MKQQESPVTFTGADAVQRYNAACKALKCQGYSRFFHFAASDGCLSAWCNSDGAEIELQVTVEAKPLVTGFARMD